MYFSLYSLHNKKQFIVKNGKTENMSPWAAPWPFLESSCSSQPSKGTLTAVLIEKLASLDKAGKERNSPCDPCQEASGLCHHAPDNGVIAAFMWSSPLGWGGMAVTGTSQPSCFAPNGCCCSLFIHWWLACLGLGFSLAGGRTSMGFSLIRTERPRWPQPAKRTMKQQHPCLDFRAGTQWFSFVHAHTPYLTDYILTIPFRIPCICPSCYLSLEHPFPCFLTELNLPIL